MDGEAKIVRCPYADIILHDPLRAAINLPDDEKQHKLYKISDLICKWVKNVIKKAVKKLANEKKT